MMTIRKISINLLLGFLFSAWLVGAPNSDAHIEIISESNAELHLQYNFENLNLHEIIINGVNEAIFYPSSTFKEAPKKFKLVTTGNFRNIDMLEPVIKALDAISKFDFSLSASGIKR